MLRKVVRLALAVSILASLLLAAPAFAESGQVQKGISLVNHSFENIRLWLGHTLPADQEGWVPPNEFTFVYTMLNYTDKSALNEYYIDDVIRVNAVKASDSDPYPSYISQQFPVKGWIDAVFVYYTADGGLEIKVTYVREDATTPAAPATTSATVAPTETAPDSKVRFSGMNGQVEVLLPGATEWDFADLHTVLPVGTHVKTGIDSSCVLSFSDMSTFVLKPEAEVVISTPPEKDPKVQLVRGHIWVNVMKMIKDGTMDIELNQTVAGIKGTTLILEDTGDTSTVKVIEGTVWVTEKKYGALSVITAGQTVTGTSGGFSGPATTFDIDAATAEWAAVRATAEAASATVAATTASSASPAATAPATSDDGGSGSSFPIVPIAVGVGVVVVLVVIMVARAGEKEEIKRRLERQACFFCRE